MQSDLAPATGYISVAVRQAPLPSPNSSIVLKQSVLPEAAALSLPVRCFGPQCEVPPWLLQPWLTLQRAAQRERPVGARLADLSQVGMELDQLFVEHLPADADWFQGSDGQGAGRANRLARWVDGVIGEAEALFQHQLRPDLASLGIVIKPVVQLDEWQRTRLQEYFSQRIYPLLTPLAVDPGRPFPYISSDSLNLLVELRSPERASSQQRASLFARIKIPRITPQLVSVASTPVSTGRATASRPAVYVCSADLVRYFVHHLFPGMSLRHVYFFRLVRGQQPIPGTTLTSHTHPRRQEDAPAVRLEVERRIAPSVLDWLVDHLALPKFAVSRHDRLFDWSCLPYLAATTQAVEAAG